MDVYGKKNVKSHIAVTLSPAPTRPASDRRAKTAKASGLEKQPPKCFELCGNRVRPIALLGGAATKGAEADVEREITVVWSTRGACGRRNVVGDGNGSRYYSRKCRDHGN